MINWPVETINNKYKQWYVNVISQAQKRILSKETYQERHHIVPQSIGGNNSKTNIVNLTAKEHFVCHRLLTRFLVGESKMKMSFAAWIMITNNNPHQKRYKVTSRVYESIKKEMANVQRTQEHREKVKLGMRNSEKQKNKVVWNKGIPMSDEQKQRLKEINTGKKHSPESIIKSIETRRRNGTLRTKGSWSPSLEAREKLRKINLGKKPSTETRQKISLALKGRKITDEQRKKLSQAKKGKPLSEKHLASIKLAQARRRAREAEEKKLKILSGELVVVPKVLKKTTAGYVNPLKGKSLSEEHRHKISLSHKGKIGHKPSEYNLQRLKEANTGRVVSAETRKKISNSQLGKIISEETRIKQSISAKKRPPISEETRKKLSAAAKGRKISQEAINKRSAKMKGRTVSAETREKIKNTLKKTLQAKNTTFIKDKSNDNLS
jgi:hypothetical protein